MNSLQMKRASIIDRAILKGKHNQKALKEEVEKELGFKISLGNIDHDLKRMREIFGAPIKYVPLTHCTGYYTYDKEYDFGDAFLKYWADYVEFSKDINKIIFQC